MKRSSPVEPEAALHGRSGVDRQRREVQPRRPTLGPVDELVRPVLGRARHRRPTSSDRASGPAHREVIDTDLDDAALGTEERHRHRHLPSRSDRQLRTGGEPQRQLGDDVATPTVGEGLGMVEHDGDRARASTRSTPTNAVMLATTAHPATPTTGTPSDRSAPRDRRPRRDRSGARSGRCRERPPTATPPAVACARPTAPTTSSCRSPPARRRRAPRAGAPRRDARRERCGRRCPGGPGRFELGFVQLERQPRSCPAIVPWHGGRTGRRPSRHLLRRYPRGAVCSRG